MFGSQYLHTYIHTYMDDGERAGRIISQEAWQAWHGLADMPKGGVFSQRKHVFRASIA